MAARVTRDTPASEDKPALDFDKLIASAKKTWDETFTKENLDVKY